MSEGEAVYIARTYYGIDAGDFYDLDVNLVCWQGALFYKVDIEPWYMNADNHVILDAYDGTVYAGWVEY